IPRLADARCAVEVANFVFELRQIFGVDEVDLVEQHHVGESNLLFRLGGLFQLLVDMLCVDNGNDAIKLIFRLDPIVDKKGLHDRGRISEASGFNHQSIEFLSVLEELEKTAY